MLKRIFLLLFNLLLLSLPSFALIRTIPPSTTPTTSTTPGRSQQQAHIEALVDRIESIDVSSTQVGFWGLRKFWCYNFDGENCQFYQIPGNYPNKQSRSGWKCKSLNRRYWSEQWREAPLVEFSRNFVGHHERFVFFKLTLTFWIERFYVWIFRSLHR
jgi:hypothetical protein